MFQPKVLISQVLHISYIVRKVSEDENSEEHVLAAAEEGIEGVG